MSILSEKTILVLDAIKKLGPTYQREIAKKTALSDTTVNAILKKLEKAGIIKSSPDTDKDSGRLIRKIHLVLDSDDLEKIICDYKSAQTKLKGALAALRKPRLKNEDSV